MKIKRNQLYFIDKFKAEFITEFDEISDESVLVKNIYSMISPGTEMALFNKTHIGFSDPKNTLIKYPIAAGYSSVGKIIQIGKNVTNLSVGDFVVHYKPHADLSIINTNTDIILKINQTNDLKRFLFVRFGQIAFTAIKASLKTKNAVLIFGGGVIGNLCAQIYKNYTGRQVILSDILDERLNLISQAGIETINSKDQEFRNKILEMTNGKGIDTIVEATGVPAVVNDCLSYVNEHGEVMLLGSSRGTIEIDPYKYIHRKFLTIYGTHENKYPKFGKENSQIRFSEIVLNYIQQNKILLDGLITDVINPNKINEAYKLLNDDKRNHLMIVIKWNNTEDIQ